MMFFGVCKGPTFYEAQMQIKQLLSDVDGIEMRLDLLGSLDFCQIKDLLSFWPKKVLFTFKGKESQELLEKWEELLSLGPDYVDLDWQCSEQLYQMVRSHSPQIKLILSYHDYSCSSNLQQVLDEMKKRKSDVYKMATLANSSLDALLMMRLYRSAKQENIPFIGICMGKYGQITRILSKILGSYICFVCLEKESSDVFQLSLKDLSKLYNISSHSQETKVYALIGSPIEHSLSPTLHNAVFRELNIDAVYVRIPLCKEELEGFFFLIRSLSFFKGLSVTMPLKEEISGFLDNIDLPAQIMRSVNTVEFFDGKLFGYNTDAKGGYLAISDKMELKNKTVFVIGAGATARSLISAIHADVKEIKVFYRSKMPELFLAGCEKISFMPLQDLSEKSCDLIINATSEDMPLEENQMPNTRVIFNACYQSDSMCNYAKSKGILYISGIDMLINQAVYQQLVWSKGLHDHMQIRNIMTLSVFRN